MRANRNRLPYRMVKVTGSLLLLLSISSLLQAEQLPIKAYTAADGLAGNRVSQIMRDSHGFLWFSTYEGLSRFDGYAFTSDKIVSGPVQPEVRSFLEARSGFYLAATKTGLYQFSPAVSSSLRRRWVSQRAGEPVESLSSQTRFVKLFPGESEKQSIWSLAEDQAGKIWIGTAVGLFRLEWSDGRWISQYIDIGLPRHTEDDTIVRVLLRDRLGSLWIGAESGLYRRFADGRTERYTTRQGLPVNQIRAIFEDREGQLWIGTRLGLCQLLPEPNRSGSIVSHVYTEADGLPSRNITSIGQSSKGKLWIGLIGGLAELLPGIHQGRWKFRAYTAAQGLNDINLWALSEDRDGNLWMGSESGVMKLARSGFTSYGKADGLRNPAIASIFEDQVGDLCVSSISGDILLSRFDGTHFFAVRPRLPKRIDYYGWGWDQLSLQDHLGQWWVPTGQGLCRFSKRSNPADLARVLPKAIYTSQDGLPFDDVFRLFEDSRGDIWIATFSEAANGLTRWERATETFHDFTEGHGLPLKTCIASAFCEDDTGNVWIAFDTGGGLARYCNGQFKLLPEASGGPQAEFPSLHFDQAGRLWIATDFLGLNRIENPNSDHPRMTTLTTSEGLSSNRVLSITEDLWGRLYLGTSRGVDRLNPTTGRIKYYTTADGLVNGEVRTSFRDRQGMLWFGTTRGLSRLIPEPDPVASHPPILIGGLHINGVAYPISELGETDIINLQLEPNQNNVQIDFFGLGFSPGESLRYRYRLDGADRDWSKLTGQRTINYASLKPGTYRFQVQTVDTDGNSSLAGATASFTILSPLWQRGWFLVLAALSAGMLGLLFFRYRVARLVEVERVRTRIATDLHDDVGSGLSQIAILSEIARQQVGQKSGPVGQPLVQIANIARELVDSMSDIVWATNPRRDRISDLSQRMRELASDLFPARNIDFRLRTPSADQNVKLDPDVRRQLFLVFKESVNNIVCHSCCTQADIEFVIENERLRLSLSDNGRGFDPTQVRPGNGLRNMQERVKKLGGVMELSTGEGKGTVISFVVPSGQGQFSFRK